MSVQSDIIFTPSKTVRRRISFPVMGHSGRHNPNSSSRNDSNAIDYKRFIDRDGDFGQSAGTMSLRKRISAKLRRNLYSEDLFHSIVNMSTQRVIALILSLYVGLIFLFALIYWYIGSNFPECNMDLHSYLDGFGFSLQTAATIGYDTGDITFGDCILPLATITVQVCCKLLADALLIGMLFCRLSRPSSRAKTIIFSENAVIRRIRGKLYFMFQVCELRKTQLHEVQVRLYAVRRDIDLSETIAKRLEIDDEDKYSLGSRDSSQTFSKKQRYKNQRQNWSNLGPRATASLYKYQSISQSEIELQENTKANSDKQDWSDWDSSVFSHFQTISMRLQHPDDSTGSGLLLCLPQIVVHELDASSPLMAPPIWMHSNGNVETWNPKEFDFANTPARPKCNKSQTSNSDQLFAKSPNEPNSLAGPTSVATGVMPATMPSNRTNSPLTMASKMRIGTGTTATAAVSNINIAGSAQVTSSSLQSSVSAISSKLTDSVSSDCGARQRSDSISSESEDSATSLDQDNNSQCSNAGGNDQWVGDINDRYKLSMNNLVGISLLTEEDDRSVSSPIDTPPGYNSSNNHLKSVNDSSPSNSRKRKSVDNSNQPALNPTVLGTCEYPSSASRGGDVALQTSQATPNTLSSGQEAYAAMINELWAPKKQLQSENSLKKPVSANFKSRFEKQANDRKGKHFSDSLREKLIQTHIETESQWYERQTLQEYHKDRQIEIIAILEGVDPATGGVVQAKHSYTAEDIQWDQTFVPCVYRDKDEGDAVVDFTLFHKLVKAPYDAATAGSMASWI